MDTMVDSTVLFKDSPNSKLDKPSLFMPILHCRSMNQTYYQRRPRPQVEFSCLVNANASRLTTFHLAQTDYWRRFCFSLLVFSFLSSFASSIEVGTQIAGFGKSTSERVKVHMTRAKLSVIRPLCCLFRLLLHKANPLHTIPDLLMSQSQRKRDSKLKGGRGPRT